MTTPLYPVEVQSLLFRQLLAYETLLNHEYRLHIKRYPSGNLGVSIVNIATGDYQSPWILNPHTLQTTKELDAAIAKFWNEVPQKYKLEQ